VGGTVVDDVDDDMADGVGVFHPARHDRGQIL
jgi:hypothetical protein